MQVSLSVGKGSHERLKFCSRNEKGELKNSQLPISSVHLNFYLQVDFRSGEYRSRTDDLLHAMQAL
jgi:hypothetical protein